MARPRAERDGLLLGQNVLTPIAAQPAQPSADSPVHSAAAAATKELHSFDANPLQILSEIPNVPSPTRELLRQLEESQANDGAEDEGGTGGGGNMEVSA